jgi:diacylglycerol kinase
VKFLKSFNYAWQGLRHCLNSEKNIRIQLCVAFIALLSGLLLKISVTDWIAILICMGLVVSLEMINTSIETLSDVIFPATHAGIKSVKDIAAGAVLIVSTISLIIGCIIFIPRILFIIKNFLK